MLLLQGSASKPVLKLILIEDVSKKFGRDKKMTRWGFIKKGKFRYMVTEKSHSLYGWCYNCSFGLLSKTGKHESYFQVDKGKIHSFTNHRPKF